ncbi:MAG TPA: saccharopine dehydrogenase NADP-binding domain-containing protein [Acidimicrobiales bacterium]|nr:saccharopine dehydrogenase NADP-binding domain-containing protein [Acidimicrobiales bacterium]
MSNAKSWVLYGAAGYTGALIAQHAQECGHRPLLAGRNGTAVTALAEKLDLPHLTLRLDDATELAAALAGIDLVLNVAGPFLHTAASLAEACLNAGAHYLDISNELQVFRALYDLHQRAEAADIAIIPGVGFGVVATNCLARYVSDAVGGAEHLEVAARAASAQAGPGVAATRQENLPYGGWAREKGQLQPLSLGSGITSVAFPDGLCRSMPVPTGDLEAAFQATGAPNIIAYTAIAGAEVVPAGTSDIEALGPQTYRSFGWARATNADGATAQAWLQTGESYAFTAAASIRSVEEALAGSFRGALSPAAAFGVDFALTVPGTTRTDAISAQVSLTQGIQKENRE